MKPIIFFLFVSLLFVVSCTNNKTYEKHVESTVSIGDVAGAAVGKRGAIVTGGAVGPLIAEAVADWSL